MLLLGDMNDNAISKYKVLIINLLTAAMQSIAEKWKSPVLSLEEWLTKVRYVRHMTDSKLSAILKV